MYQSEDLCLRHLPITLVSHLTRSSSCSLDVASERPNSINEQTNKKSWIYYYNAVWFL